MAQFETRITPELPSNPCSILNFLKAGANLEDVPNPRARHHFHAPIANLGVTPPNPNSGLDNRTDHPDWAETFDFWTDYFYKLHFDLTGASAENRALGTEGAGWETEYLNYYAWPDTRTYFYRALTKPNLAGRNHYLALTFISLGQTAHLLEDMGVPAHTRNDFVYGHMALMGITPSTWGKNPFEYWAEQQVKANSNNIPSSWLTGWTPQAKVFDKIAKYWDTDTYSGTYIGLPLSAWGLSEQTNYQFISTSTFPGGTGTLYQFPNPSTVHFGTDLTEYVPSGLKLYFNGSNYGVPHIARKSYTKFYANQNGFYNEAIDSTITPDDNSVYQDYVRVTVPRTIDYATGLINYFFRGKLKIEQTDSNDGKIHITITNKSTNSDVNQILKGGTFTLYWDDSSGNRTPVSDFTIYRPGTEPVAGNEWNSTTQMNYDQTTKAVLTPPTQGNVQYILVYEGIISSNPNSPDSDDTHQIATGKAQMGFVTCVLCPVGTNARNLTVKISNIPACNNVCVGMGGSDESSWKYNNVPDMDGEYVLPLIDSIDGSNYWCPNCGQCVWQNTYSGNFGSALRYGDYDDSCTGAVQDITNFTTLVVRVVLIKALNYYPYPGWSLSVSWYLYPMVYGNGTNFVLSGGLALYSETATPPPDCANYVWESTTDNDCFPAPGVGWRTRLSPTSKVELIMGQ
ncbi:MAG: hypothetical protein WC454_04725 [Phycisphaerae bacterium]